MKVQLNVESNLGPTVATFDEANDLIVATNVNVQKFGKDSQTAFKAATSEADKFEKEVKTGTKQVSELSNSTQAVGKSANRLREIKNEMKALTSEAIKAGAGTKVFTENLKRVGELKDELADIQAAVSSVAGNITENLGGALASTTNLAATGFEAATAASALFGDQNKEVEKQLLKLNAIKSLANITKEFGGIGDKLTEIKLAFSPVTGALANFYNSGNEGLKRLSKEGFGSLFKDINFSAKGVFKSITSGITNFVKSGISGIKSLGAAVAANPFGLILITITALIGIMVLLRDKVKPIAILFDAIGDAINKVGDDLERFGQLLGIVDDASEKRAKNSIKNYEDELNAIRERYQFEIDLAEASGKSTKRIEQEKFKAEEDRIKQSLAAQLYLTMVNGKASEEEIKLYKETKQELIKINQQATISLAKEQTQLRKQEEDAEKKKQEDAKKNAERLKQLRKDLSDSLLDLAKRAQASEIEQLTGEEKINAQRKAAQQEIDLLKETIIKKQIAAGLGNKLTLEQQAQLHILEKGADQKQAEDLLKLRQEQSNKIAAQQRKETDDEIKFLDTKTKLAIAAIEGSKNTTGLSEVEFEKEKQKQILAIQRDAAIASLEIKKKSIADQEGVSQDQIAAEQDLLVQETKNLTDKINAEIDKLNEKPKFSLAALLGLTPEEFEKAKAGVIQLVGQATEIADTYFAKQQEQLDLEIQANQARIDSREKNVDDLNSKLEQELELQRQGLANNVDGLKAQIEATESARLQDLENEKRIREEKKKLAKQQFIIDTATQSLNLLTASTEIFKTYSGIPFIGIPLAIGLIGTMIGTFIATKAKALQAINAGGGFKKGGYTGGSSIDEERGVVHGKEFVHTAEDTSDYRNLFEGIHTKNKPLLEKGLAELLEGTGVSLGKEGQPMELANKKESVRANEFRTYYNLDNSKLEEQLDKHEKHLSELVKNSKVSRQVLPNGDILIKVGNNERRIKGKL